MKRNLFHVLIVLNYIIAFWYDLTYVDIGKLNPKNDLPMKGRLAFLTIWNMVSTNDVCI